MASINDAQQAMLQRMSTMQAEAQRSLVAPSSNGSSENTSFGSIFHSTLNNVNQQQLEAGKMAHQIETGASDDLTGTMIAAQKASISFSALTQVRNKLITAYDEVMKMPL